MRGISKLAVAVVPVVAIGVFALALAAPGAAGKKHPGANRVVLLGTTQNLMLKHGLRVRLPGSTRPG